MLIFECWLDLSLFKVSFVLNDKVIYFSFFFLQFSPIQMNGSVHYFFVLNILTNTAVAFKINDLYSRFLELFGSLSVFRSEETQAFTDGISDENLCIFFYRDGIQRSRIN